MNGRERPRMPPAGEIPPLRDPRRAGDGPNGSFGSPGDSAMSRAEKFDDEKKRIIQHCFGKKDKDGTSIESYITHVRITEDAAYPSVPPPPSSQPDNKKARVIIIAVRRSGRVRMHKGRENHDGTFSIGKTWDLDDLSAIQSYNAWTPSNPTEEQQKQYASNVGFMVTIQKPYYWHARSSKEKEFFIGSLLKIYRKYTGGRAPKLIGFDDRERQLLVGTPPASRGPGQGSTPPGGAMSPPQPPSSQASRSQSPYTNRMPSRDDLKESRRQPSDEHSLRAQRSRDQMRNPPPGQPVKSAMPPPLAPPQGPPPAIPQDQRDQPPRTGERGDTRMPKTPIMAPESKGKEFPSDVPAIAPLNQKGKPFGKSEESLANSQADIRPPSSRDGKGAPEPRPALRSQNSFPVSPESKRSNDGLPPTTPGSISGESRNLPQSSASSLGQKYPVNESSDKISTPEALDGSVVDQSPVSPPDAETSAPAPSREAAPSESVTEAAAISSPTSPSGLDDEPDAHRPGLGPMVKKKQSKDVVGAFRKAANAYGAFRPRPGGAGERLMAAAKKQQVTPDEPDGITSVVPAPSLLRAEPTSPETPDNEIPSPIASPAKETPTVEVAQPAIEEPAAKAVEPPEQPRDTSRAAVKVDSGARPRSVSGGRRKRNEDSAIKCCQALGIEPTVLDGRGVDFDDILTDLGWNGRLGDDKRIEDLEADVRREIGRVEATCWLGNLEQQEGKVDQLARLIDRTMEECDELDGLLTLYAHELHTLHDDVSYIETQSQGLQVQTANQKLLQSELQNMLKTVPASRHRLRDNDKTNCYLVRDDDKPNYYHLVSDDDKPNYYFLVRDDDKPNYYLEQADDNPNYCLDPTASGEEHGVLPPSYYIAQGLEPIESSLTSTTFIPQDYTSDLSGYEVKYPDPQNPRVSYYVDYEREVNGGITVNGNNFTLIYQGFYRAPTTGMFRFCVSADNVDYFYLGDDSAFNCNSGEPDPNAPSLNIASAGGNYVNPISCGTVQLEAGQFYPVRSVFGNGDAVSAYNLTIQAPGGTPENSNPGLLYPMNCLAV